MKNKFWFTLAALAMAVCFSGCRKETTVLRLTIDNGQHGSKVAINENRIPVWQDGDKININGSAYTLSASSQQASVQVPVSDNGYVAVYPSSSSINGSTVSVSIPTEQSYQVKDGVQEVKAPMVGYAPRDANTITMKNLCTLLKVTVTKPSNINSLIINTIELSSTTADLSGNGTSTASDPTPQLTLSSNQTKCVSLTDIGFVLDATTPSKTFYIYTAPFATSTIDFKITAREAHKYYTFTRNASIAGTSGQMWTVPADLGTFQREESVEAFSVSNNMKVRFSKGNLRYNYQTGAWGLTSSQEYCSGTKLTSDNWFEYFGWGTWSEDDKDSICRTINKGERYLNNISGIANILAVSWSMTITENGTVTSVTRDARDSYSASNWRLLTRPEWEYLINNRQGNRYVKCRVNSNGNRGNGVAGLLLFPDDFTIPSTIESAHDSIHTWVNNQYARYNSTLFSADEWTALSNDGCVFLPAAGLRTGDSNPTRCGQNGYYWSSSPQTSNCAGVLDFRDDGANNNTVETVEGQSRYYGFNIRLVQTIPSSKK